jgi:hypothetical protein
MKENSISRSSFLKSSTFAGAAGVVGTGCAASALTSCGGDTFKDKVDGLAGKLKSVKNIDYEGEPSQGRNAGTIQNHQYLLGGNLADGGGLSPPTGGPFVHDKGQYIPTGETFLHDGGRYYPTEETFPDDGGRFPPTGTPRKEKFRITNSIRISVIII